MTEIDYLNKRAAELRTLAKDQNDSFIKQRLLALADECERLVASIRSRMNGDH